jgi:hypothetical protein
LNATPDEYHERSSRLSALQQPESKAGKCHVIRHHDSDWLPRALFDESMFGNQRIRQHKENRSSNTNREVGRQRKGKI